MAAYARQLALNYARTFYDRVCSDGRVALKSGYPKAINNVVLAPGMPFSSIGAIPDEEDCTHFISCCIGRPPTVFASGWNISHGGGLVIDQPFGHVFGVYGQTWAPLLVKELIARGYAKVVGPTFVPNHYVETRVKIRAELRPGDLLAYASKDDSLKYEHFGILVGPDTICCHTRSRYGDDFAQVYHPWITMLKLPQ